MSGLDKPAALGRGYITEALNAGQPKEVAADRVDMTHNIMEKHYDRANKNKNIEQLGKLTDTNLILLE